MKRTANIYSSGYVNDDEFSEPELMFKYSLNFDCNSENESHKCKNCIFKNFQPNVSYSIKYLGKHTNLLRSSDTLSGESHFKVDNPDLFRQVVHFYQGHCLAR